MFWLLPILATSVVSSLFTSQFAVEPTSFLFSLVTQAHFADAPLLEPDIPWTECFIPDAGPHNAVGLPANVSLSVIPPSTVLLPLKVFPLFTASPSIFIVRAFTGASIPADDKYTIFSLASILAVIVEVAALLAVLSWAFTGERVISFDTVPKLALGNLRDQDAQTDNVVQDTSTSSNFQSAADSDICTGNMVRLFKSKHFSTPLPSGQSPVGISQRELDHPIRGNNVNPPEATPSHPLDSEEDNDTSVDSSDSIETLAQHGHSLNSMVFESDILLDVIKSNLELHIPESALDQVAGPLSSVDPEAIEFEDSKLITVGDEQYGSSVPSEASLPIPLPAPPTLTPVDDSMSQSLRDQPIAPPAFVSLDEETILNGASQETSYLVEKVECATPMEAPAGNHGSSFPSIDGSNVDSEGDKHLFPPVFTVLPLTDVASREDSLQPGDTVFMDEDLDEGDRTEEVPHPAKSKRRRGGRRGDAARIPARLAWEAAQLSRSGEGSETGSAHPSVSSEFNDCDCNQLPSAPTSEAQDATPDDPELKSKKKVKRGGKRGDRVLWEAREARMASLAAAENNGESSQAGTIRLTASSEVDRPTATPSTTAPLPRPRLLAPSTGQSSGNPPEAELRQDRPRTHSQPSTSNVYTPISRSFLPSIHAAPPAPRRRVMIQTDVLSMLGNVVRDSQSTNARREQERLERLGP